MINISKITVLVASIGATALPAAAETEPMADTCSNLSWVTVEGKQVCLPVQVVDNIIKLQVFGTRYARAIDLIVEENERPH